MNELPNLRGNFKHVLEGASLRDIHVMLSVLHDELEQRLIGASVLVGVAADSLSDYLASRAPRNGSPVCGDTACMLRHSVTGRHLE